jgi:hypothetical protein
MYSRTIGLALTAWLFSTSVIASPTPTQEINNIERRQLLSNLLRTVLNPVLGAIDDVVDGESDTDDPFGSLLDILKPLKSVVQPSSVEEAHSAISDALQASPTPNNLISAAAKLVTQGLTTDNVVQALDYVDGLLTGENSETNDNPIDPPTTIYPQADPNDAPYSLSEAALRAAIHIPSTFQYGKPGAPQPVILVPGTGNTGYLTFAGNLIPLLQGSTIADPVWLNIPGFLLNDAQLNAEYVAYAINYIHAISNSRRVAVVAWSQGNINSQWAYKYWPSTRALVTDHVGFSPDYHGTVLANIIEIPGAPLPPSLLQQAYDSDYITTLRRDGGDSSYVPTTNIYSGFIDEIVEPQSGAAASGRLLNARGAGASNNEVQVVCAGQLAGSLYTHEGTLYNPLGFALLKDALANEGEGRPERLDLGAVCNDFVAPGLVLSDVLETENQILVAALAILTYPRSVFVEPAIMGMWFWTSFLPLVR